jgi:prolyl-tRNA synthetase
MHIWNEIRDWFSDKTRKMGVKETSFPMFLSKTSLEKEKEHVEGFAPELAWVTKAGDKDLEVPVAVRPTSEAVMYPYYAKWIRSHRDLPLRLQQWNSVVCVFAPTCSVWSVILKAHRFVGRQSRRLRSCGQESSSGKRATRLTYRRSLPRRRSCRFLSTTRESTSSCSPFPSFVASMLYYYRVRYDLEPRLLMPDNRKTEAEKFAGGYWTSTVEGFIPSTGRGIQGATSQ